MKKCPFCAEEIQDQAIKCRYCNEFLNKPSNFESDKTKTKWYFSTHIIIWAFLFLGPFALPLVILNPKYNLITKVIISFLIIAITIAICFYLRSLYVDVNDQLRQLGLY